jgi:hypothetical protein
MSARQIAQAQISYSHPHQPFHFVTDGIKHPPDLLVNSLPQNNAHLRLTGGNEPRNLRALTIEKNPAQQFLRERAVPGSI